MERVEETVAPSLLRNRDFIALWLAQALSQIAANALTATLIVFVFARTQTNVATSFLVLLAIIPPVLLGPIAGVAVDRIDRKLVLIATNVLRGIAVFAMLLLGENVEAAYTVIFLVAAVTVFFVPAEAATIPRIVRRQDLLAANSLFSLTFNGSFFIGFTIVAPVVLRIAGFEALFVVLTSMYAVAAVLCTMLPRSGPVARPLGVDVAERAWSQTRRDIAEALTYLRTNRRLMWVLFYVALTYMLIAVAGALAPGFVTAELGLEERDIYVLSLSAAVGVGFGLLMLNVGRHMARATLIHWGLVTSAVALVALAMAGPGLRFTRALVEPDPQLAFVGLVMAAAIVFGAAYTFVTVPALTLLQEELRDDMRGRVFSVMNMMVSVVSLAPLLIVGTIADAWGVGPIFAAAAVVVFVSWLLGRGWDMRRPMEGEPATR